MKRLDQWLVDLKIAPSRVKAKELIENQQIQIDSEKHQGKKLAASLTFESLNAEQVQILDNALLKYVSRSGLKLEGALREISLDLSELIAMDVGQSTGGFTDCLLSFGVKKVIGFDVGKGQLAAKLQNHPQVEFFENVNAKQAQRHPGLTKFLGQIDLLAMDVSFISVEKVLSEVSPFLKTTTMNTINSHVVILIKPQFELGSDALNKKGIVKDLNVLEDLKVKMQSFFADNGWRQIQLIESPITGRDGNQEFFIYAKR